MIRVENDGINQIVLKQICFKCNSLGETTKWLGAKCGECDGNGTKTEHIPAKFIREAEHDLKRDIWEDLYDAKVKCITCHGIGFTQSKQEICDNCNGNGTLEIDLRVNVAKKRFLSLKQIAVVSIFLHVVRVVVLYILLCCMLDEICSTCTQNMVMA